MAATAPPNHARSTLRWKLFALVAVMAVGSAAATLALGRQPVERFVRSGEIERLRDGPLAQLKQRCTDYFTDRDRDGVEKLMASLAATHDEVAYLCFLDPDLGDDAVLSSHAAPPEALRALAGDTQPPPPEGQVRRIGDETVIDIAETTATKPAYTLHLGLRKAAVNEKTRELLVKMTISACVIAGAAIVVAFGLIILLVGPLEKLAADASRLSLGDMGVTFNPRGRGELGRLADALDRLKESVLCALRRGALKRDSKK